MSGLMSATRAARTVAFGLPDGGGQRRELTVDVGDTHIVEVHQGEFAHAAAGECFGRPGAHAAEANDSNMSGAQPGRAGFPQHPRHPAEPILIVTHAAGELAGQLSDAKPAVSGRRDRCPVTAASRQGSSGVKSPGAGGAPVDVQAMKPA